MTNMTKPTNMCLETGVAHCVEMWQIWQIWQIWLIFARRRGQHIVSKCDKCDKHAWQIWLIFALRHRNVTNVTNMTNITHVCLEKGVVSEFNAWNQLDGWLCTYHSLVIDKKSLPSCFKITAWTNLPNGEMDEIMGIRHLTLPLFGVQFHPESILTEHGHLLLKNFLTQ